MKVICKARTGLVAQKKQVTRGGKTYQTTVWVRANKKKSGDKSQKNDIKALLSETRKEGSKALDISIKAIDANHPHWKKIRNLADNINQIHNSLYLEYISPDEAKTKLEDTKRKLSDYLKKNPIGGGNSNKKKDSDNKKTKEASKSNAVEQHLKDSGIDVDTKITSAEQIDKAFEALFGDDAPEDMGDDWDEQVFEAWDKLIDKKGHSTSNGWDWKEAPSLNDFKNTAKQLGVKIEKGNKKKGELLKLTDPITKKSTVIDEIEYEDQERDTELFDSVFEALGFKTAYDRTLEGSDGYGTIVYRPKAKK